uniref:Uncharacterized protein n=1 Tax=Anguilla anguilla TaxID=7936 RepID=A0A0E9VBQ6_ANGAN
MDQDLGGGLNAGEASSWTKRGSHKL